jgi:hypothetical protein
VKASLRFCTLLDRTRPKTTTFFGAQTGEICWGGSLYAGTVCLKSTFRKSVSWRQNSRALS